MGVAWDTYSHENRSHVAHGDISDKMGKVCRPHDATEQAWTRGRENKAYQESAVAWLREAHRVLRPGGRVKAFGGTRTFHRLGRAMEDVGFGDVSVDAWGYATGFPKSLDVGKAIDRRGGSDAPREAFYAHLREKRLASGLSRTEITEQVTGVRTGSCWNWEHYALPEPRYWQALKDLLGLDSSFDDLILGAEREVVQERTMVQGGGSSLEMRLGERREVRADITAPATEASVSWHGWGTAFKPAWEPVLVGTKPC